MTSDATTTGEDAGEEMTRALPEVSSLRRDQRERRQRIIDAAERLMAEVDYDRIQVKDVADAADVALGTLYRYFNSKDHLFACALWNWSQGFGDRLGSHTAGPTADRVRTIYRLAARAFEKQPLVYGVVLQLQTTSDPHAAEVFRDFARRQSEVFGSALDGARVSDQKRQDVTDVMNAVLDTALRNWRLGLHPIEDVYAAVDRAAGLVLGP